MTAGGLAAPAERRSAAACGLLKQHVRHAPVVAAVEGEQLRAGQVEEAPVHPPLERLQGGGAKGGAGQWQALQGGGMRGGAGRWSALQGGG